MDYQAHYDRLIERARHRKLFEYKEKHHVRPKCIGGTNEKSNLVDLTAEEHYVAHLLLAKIYCDVPPILNAAFMMACRNNKAYGWVMRKYAKLASERFKNVPKTIQHREKQSEAKKKSIEYKGKIYRGFTELKEQTGVTYYLYNKYYVHNVDPLPYIGNNTYGMIKAVKNNPPRAAKNKNWYNNGMTEKYSKEPIAGWQRGRLFNTRDTKGRYTQR